MLKSSDQFRPSTVSVTKMFAKAKRFNYPEDSPPPPPGTCSRNHPVRTPRRRSLSEGRKSLKSPRELVPKDATLQRSLEEICRTLERIYQMESQIQRHSRCFSDEGFYGATPSPSPHYDEIDLEGGLCESVAAVLHRKEETEKQKERSLWGKVRALWGSAKKNFKNGPPTTPSAPSVRKGSSVSTCSKLPRRTSAQKMSFKQHSHSGVSNSSTPSTSKLPPTLTAVLQNLQKFEDRFQERCDTLDSICSDFLNSPFFNNTTEATESDPDSMCPQISDKELEWSISSVELSLDSEALSEYSEFLLSAAFNEFLEFSGSYGDIEIISRCELDVAQLNSKQQSFWSKCRMLLRGLNGCGRRVLGALRPKIVEGAVEKKRVV